MAGPDPTNPPHAAVKVYGDAARGGRRAASPMLSGLLAGVLAAVVWAVLVYLTHNSIPLAAWGVGGLVGLAVAAPARGAEGESRSITAVLLAGGAVVLAKVLILEAALPPIMREEILRSREATAAMFLADMTAHRSFSPELEGAIDSLARGRPGAPGGGAGGGFGAEQSEELQYRMISEARDRAAEASPDERERVVRAAMGGVLGRLGFLPLLGRSFGLFDLLWLGLGLSTAWKLGQSPAPRPSFGSA